MMLVLARVPALRLLRTPRGVLTIAGWMLVAIDERAPGASGRLGQWRRSRDARLVRVPRAAAPLVRDRRRRRRTLGITQGIRGVSRSAPIRGARRSLRWASRWVPRPSRARCSRRSCARLHTALMIRRSVVTSSPHCGSAVSAEVPTERIFLRDPRSEGDGLRGVFLVIDWWRDRARGISALFTPRGHVERCSAARSARRCAARELEHARRDDRDLRRDRASADEAPWLSWPAAGCLRKKNRLRH